MNLRRLLSRAAPARLLCLGLLASGIGFQGVGQTIQENALIASYLTAFNEFTRWETATRDRPIRIGVLAAPKVLGELKLIEAKIKDSAPSFTSINWTSDQRLDEIDILYISRNYKNNRSDIISRARKASTLTVSSGPGFLDEGGLISFHHQRNRLRFSISIENARDYGIRFSSKLVQIAVPEE